jgi:protein TonB
MIRSPQAFLISLSLHLLMATAFFTFVVPGITSPQQSAVTRCRIALSQVVPALPEMAAETPEHAVPPVRKAVKKPVTQPTPVSPAVKKAVEVKRPAAESAVQTEPVPAAQPEAAAGPETIRDTVVPTETEAVPTEIEATDASSAAASSAAPSVPAEPVETAEPVQSSESYLNEHLAVIAKLLQEHLYYPRMARKRHIEGEVLATFTVGTDGTVHGIGVKKHARAILDRAAVKTIESLSGHLPHPQRALTLDVPIRFVLK